MRLGVSPIDTPFDLTMRAGARTAVAALERRIERSPAPGAPLEAVSRSAAAAADPVVLIPGYGATARSWSAIARGLERDGFRVHVFEPSGFSLGRTEPLVDELDAFVTSVLDSEQGARAVQLVGHSKGGLVAEASLRRQLDAGTTPTASSLVTLGTPSHGLPSTMASNPALGAALLMGGPSSSAILQTEAGPFVRSLRVADIARRVPTTTIFSDRSDGLVPEASARIRGARATALEHRPSHMGLLTDAAAFDALRGALLGGSR